MDSTTEINERAELSHGNDTAGERVSAERLEQIAAYAELPLTAERAALLAPLMAGPLATLRGLRPDGYDDLQPAVAYQIPRES